MSTDLQQRTFLARRLAVAIATPIAVLLFLGFILGQQILQMSEDSRRVEHSSRVLGTAYQTYLQIIDQETAVRGYLLTEESAFMAPFENARPLEGFARLEALTADNPAQAKRFEEVRFFYERWLASISPSVEAKNFSTARSMDAMWERKRRMDGIRGTMKEAIEAEEALRQTLSATSQESTQKTQYLFVGLLGGVALLLALLSRRQLSSITDVFSKALAAEQLARDATEREAWIQTGQAKVAAAMQGEKTVAQVGQDCLNALAEYTNADIGALFLKEGKTWRRRAGVALDAQSAPETFLEGEGLIGRAAAENKLIEVQEIPAGSLTLRSGTGAVLPVHAVAFPAQVEGVTYAVVELAFVRPAASRTLALLSRVGESIAIAARSAENKERMRDLLEETQRQAEELQTQQEELRVQNEELEEQSHALQESKTRLQNQQTELEEINAQLEEQASALGRQRDDLSRAQSTLQRANEYKSEFLANMSHELRTPLNSSLILAKLLIDNREGNLTPEQVKFAQTIYSACNDLLVLINDILDLSKIEAGKLDVRPEEIQLQRMLDELLDAFRPIAKEKHLALGAYLEEGVPASLYSDWTRLSQILKNLLSNALKFTDTGGVTLLVQRAEGGRLAFLVRDTGVGIPVEQQAVIFEAFRQADGTSNRKYGGTGLGLSISLDLARLLGGELTVESEPGRGSTFTLVLPERHAAKAPNPTAPQEAGARPPRPRVAQAPPRVPPSPSVEDDRARLVPGERSLLIIEDDLPFARVLYDLAHELDFKALIALTAQEGLEMAERYRPNAIVLDVGLPDRSGLSVLDALKHNPITRHAPVHIMSVSDYTQTALEMGAAGYAIKPVQREQIVEAFRRLEAKFTQKLRRVLVVEDDEVHRESTCHLLATDDVETIPVGTSAEALTQLRTTTFDCMVLDLSLPDRTGLDLLEEMAQKEQYGFPPVIVYTGRSLSREEEQQLRRFSQSIIIKGARSPERLLDEVTLFLHKVESDLPPERQRMLRDARHREAVFEGRRVLIVEDDVRNVFALTSVLEPKGAKVEIARNGKEALKHLKEKPGVDLVLMDIMMPEMDGLQATREIRNQPEYTKLPIIALTAKAMADDRESCLAAGANDYIAKPLDIGKLLSLARVWMPK